MDRFCVKFQRESSTWFYACVERKVVKFHSAKEFEIFLVHEHIFLLVFTVLKESLNFSVS